jgi:arylsulfatase A-like enzyme
MKARIIAIALILVTGLFGFIFKEQHSESIIKENKQKPNIVIIVSDDQGYADVSYHEHPPEVSTPAIDKLASEGVVFTNGYASAYVCAPTRAGLLTGRYQQRFGFYRAPDSRRGLPLSEKTIAQYLKEEGYATGIFGKWHLGLEYEYRPLQRGFDEFYGFLGHGGHDYFDLSCHDDAMHACIYRNNEIINDEGYLTDNLAREACGFIKKNADGSIPFFLYLPFNAVHWPLQAPESDIAKFNTGDKKRDIMLGMLHRMDLAVAQVIETLKATGQYENTLIFYFSDNGGAARIHADNSPLRDYKQSTYEGGLRVPFIISWPDKINPGISHEPVISLDVFPTVFAALGEKLPKNKVFDGRDIMPVINGKLKKPLHDHLVWDGDDDKWAIREGDYKLVKNKKGDIELYNLKDDIGETENKAEEYPELVLQLKRNYLDWRSEMGNPMSKK